MSVLDSHAAATPSPPPRANPVQDGQLGPVYPLAGRDVNRAQSWVQTTLFAVVSALILYCMALPIPGPRRDAAQAERRLVGVRLVLGELRAVLADYHADHGLWPGQGRSGTPAFEQFTAQIGQPTDEHGEVVPPTEAPAAGPPRRPFGPYLRGGVPANPANGLATVRFLHADEPWPEFADSRTGWIYRPATGEIRANATGRAFDRAPPYYDL